MTYTPRIEISWKKRHRWVKVSKQSKLERWKLTWRRRRINFPMDHRLSDKVVNWLSNRELFLLESQLVVTHHLVSAAGHRNPPALEVRFHKVPVKPNDLDRWWLGRADNGSREERLSTPRTEPSARAAKAGETTPADDRSRQVRREPATDRFPREGAARWREAWNRRAIGTRAPNDTKANNGPLSREARRRFISLESRLGAPRGGDIAAQHPPLPVDATARSSAVGCCEGNFGNWISTVYLPWHVKLISRVAQDRLDILDPSRSSGYRLTRISFATRISSFRWNITSQRRVVVYKLRKN